MIRIRKASLKDFDQVYSFINELESTVFDKKNQRAIYKRNLANPQIICLVAEYNGALTGFLSCHIQLLLHHCAPVAEIQELFVSRSMRSKGVGKTMLSTLKRMLKKKGIVQIEAVSNAKRLRAHKFFLREQFQFTSRKFVLIDPAPFG